MVERTYKETGVDIHFSLKMCWSMTFVIQYVRVTNKTKHLTKGFDNSCTSFRFQRFSILEQNSSSKFNTAVGDVKGSYTNFRFIYWIQSDNWISSLYTENNVGKGNITAKLFRIHFHLKLIFRLFYCKFCCIINWIQGNRRRATANFDAVFTVIIYQYVVIIETPTAVHLAVDRNWLLIVDFN